MLTSLIVKNAVDSYATSIALDTIDANGVGFPLTHFEWKHVMDGDEVPRAAAPGQWPWMKVVRNMTISLSGTILARTTTEYWSQRKALLQKMVPSPTNLEFDPVKFEMVIDGDTTTYSAFCVLEDIGDALDVDATHSPTVSLFDFTYNCRVGYWSTPTGLVIL